MEDIAQNITHLSNHLISSLSKSSSHTLEPSKSPSTSNWETVHGTLGFLNHNLFLSNRLRGDSHDEKHGEQLGPLRIFAKFWPFAVYKSDKVDVASSTPHVEKKGSQNNGNVEEMSNSRALEDQLLAVGHPALEEPEYGKLDGVLESLGRTQQGSSGSAVSKEELGRSTWAFLHTLAAQFPEHPTKQQQRDAKDLMQILSRIYPCKECADHFKDVLRTHPVETGSAEQLAQWMCRVHNVVNRSLGKKQFPCHRVDLRWGALDCNEGVCDLHGRLYR